MRGIMRLIILYYWKKLGHTKSVFKTEWPKVDKEVIEHANIKIPVQINSKNITILTVSKGMDEDELTEMAMLHVNAKLNGQKIKKVIFVPDRIINFVVK